MGIFISVGFMMVSLFALSASKQDVDPCVSHTELRDGNRSQFNFLQEADIGKCDDNLPIGWYRFKGKAGLKMPESCVGSGYCGTHSPGWLQGSHPTVDNGIIDAKVCFNWVGACCQWLMPVKVKNCTGFYVYRLGPVSYCDLRYCGDGAPDLECSADNNDILVNSSSPGSISSPNFPDKYPNSLQCTWRITAPAGSRVRLALKNLTLGANDYVIFQDGVQNNSPQIGKYADCAKGELRLYSTDRYMLVKFISDASTPGIGFQLDYEMVVSSKVKCSTYKDVCSLSNDVRNMSGVIRSPGLPVSPGGNLDCYWTLILPAGYRVLTSFSWFGMMGKLGRSRCADDYMELRVYGAAQSDKYCGCEMPLKRLYDNETVYTAFYNYEAANQAGFLFYYRAVAPGECLGGVDSCEMNVPPVGMNKEGDLCYEPEEKPTTTPPPTTTQTTPTTQPSTAASTPPPTTTTKASSTKPPTSTTPEENTLDVTCRDDSIDVVLHISSTLKYDPGSARLNDPSCKPYFENTSHVFIKSPLEGCDMAWNISEDDQEIVYQNAIHADVKKAAFGKYVTRDHQAVFVFQCRYKRLAVLSTVSFNPALVYIITNVASFGNFTFEMNMFKSEKFMEYYTDYPVGPVDLGTELFLQVAVKSNDSELVVFVDECKATSTADYDDETQYYFIEDGCSKDNSLLYNYTLSSVQRFTLKAFRFRTVNSEEIFLHCQVKACRRSDPSSHCAKGCPFGKRRKRSADHEVDRYLAIGPIIVSSSSNEPGDQSESQSLKDEHRTVAFEVVVVVLGCLAAILVVALLALVWKRQKQPNQEGAPTLLLNDDEAVSSESGA